MLLSAGSHGAELWWGSRAHTSHSPPFLSLQESWTGGEVHCPLFSFIRRDLLTPVGRGTDEKSPDLAIKKCVFILIFHWLTVSPIIKLKDDTHHMIFDIVHRDLFSKVYFVNTQFLVLLVLNCASWPGFFTTHCFVVCLCKSLITQIRFFFFFYMSIHLLSAKV